MVEHTAILTMADP